MSREKQRFKLKNDHFRQVRGGQAQFLSLYCTACGQFVMLYQKDGKGSLMRCYLNRISFPESLSRLQETARRREDVPALKCQCGAVLGHTMLYRDGRIAYRLVPHAIRSRIGVFVPQQSVDA